MKTTKVLIVDDSSSVRRVLEQILSSDENIRVTGSASDPYVAVERIAMETPDVIILDLEMPNMDGLTFLRKIMSQHPIPVVIFSSLSKKGTEASILALEYGAVAVVKKPESIHEASHHAVQSIIDVVKSAAAARIKRKAVATPVGTRMIESSPGRPSSRIIAVGASTGGTEAILQFLQEMSEECSGIVIVQHMPEVFTRSFAERLNRLCRITVKEAAHGDVVLRGQALIAPGDKHMEIRKNISGFYVHLTEEQAVNRHRPSVDVLFNSVAAHAGKNAAGILMTGMGSDGARGLLQMHRAGATTVAQDESTCVVFGMPKEAIRLGAVQKVLPLQRIPAYIQQLF